MFKEKTLLITGGTGSFGNAVLRRFLNSDVKEIRIFSRDEKKQDDMRHKYNSLRVKYYIGDVRNYESINVAMTDVDYVFHAAALKQVPSCEFFPMEAVRTNVMGTENVLNSAIFHKVKKVIVLSTDKACYPINAMGISKAMMEKVATAKALSLSKKSKTTICCTRYGNVMASRGSVIPLWLEQIKKGNKITITNAKMTRFMMTLEDAIDLVLFAFEHGKNGDLFVQKSPAATLKILSEAIHSLFNIPENIQIIGTRHGEKLHETLISKEERLKSEDLGDYFRVVCDGRDLNYNKYFNVGDKNFSDYDDYHSHNANQLNLEEMKKLLLKLNLIKKD